MMGSAATAVGIGHPPGLMRALAHDESKGLWRLCITQELHAGVECQRDAKTLSGAITSGISAGSSGRALWLDAGLNETVPCCYYSQQRRFSILGDAGAESQRSCPSTLYPRPQLLLRCMHCRLVGNTGWCFSDTDLYWGGEVTLCRIRTFAQDDIDS